MDEATAFERKANMERRLLVVGLPDKVSQQHDAARAASSEELPCREVRATGDSDEVVAGHTRVGKLNGQRSLAALVQEHPLRVGLEELLRPRELLGRLVNSTSIPARPGDGDVDVAAKRTVLVREQEHVIAEDHQQVA